MFSARPASSECHLPFCPLTWQPAPVATHPWQLLERRGALDYDDLVGMAVALLDVPAVRQAVASAYSHILVDEYQVSGGRHGGVGLLGKMVAPSPLIRISHAGVGPCALAVWIGMANQPLA